MKIDFAQMVEEEIPQFKGGEKVTYAKLYNDEKARIMHGRLTPGASIGWCTSSPALARCCTTAERRPWRPVTATTARKAIPTPSSTTARRT